MRGRKERQTKQKREKKWDSGYATQRNATQRKTKNLALLCVLGLSVLVWDIYRTNMEEDVGGGIKR